MCGRFALSTPIDQVASEIEAEPLSDLTPFEPSWNVAPQSLIPVATEIGHNGAQQVARQFRLMRWGFRPSWAKASNREPINARCETIHEKPMFHSAAQQRRGAVPVDGWYEWMTTPQGKTPWYHHVREGRSMMAVLWDTWNGGGQDLESCVVLTQAANKDCFEVHNRMPVLLDNHNLEVWLKDGTLPSLPEAGSINRYPVSRNVNHAEQNHPGLIRPIPRLFDHE
jgi:putative SOS response-associated peptidase YedK